MPNNQQLTRPIAVGVKVTVAESGAVNEAEVVDYGDPRYLVLANAALSAARKWTFEPTRVDDIPGRQPGDYPDSISARKLATI